MKRYKSKFDNYRKLSLIEAVVNPNLYLKDVESKLDKFLVTIKGKKHSPSKLCFKLGWVLASNRVRCEYEKNIIPNVDDSYKYGLNSGACAPDRRCTIKLYMNNNIVNIQNSTEFSNEFKKWFLFVLKHELIHRGQFLTIENHKIRAEVMIKDNSSIERQLQDKQEIMARAWEIIELYKLTSGLDNSKIKNQIKNYPEYTTNNVLRIYRDLFGKDSKELKLLYKYMYEYLEV